MFVIYGLSKTNPITFLNYIEGRKGKDKIRYLIEPNKTEEKTGKNILAIFFTIPKMMSFLRQIAVKKARHTILLFAPQKIMEELGINILDNKTITNINIASYIINNPNTQPPSKIPTLKRDADIFDLVAKSKSEKSFLQAYQALFYTFQFSMQKDIKNAVLLFLTNKIGIEDFKTKMLSFSPKRGNALIRFQGIIDLTISDIGLTLKKAVVEVLKTKEVEKNIKQIANKYDISPFDVRYFVMLWTKGESRDSGVLGRIIKKNEFVNSGKSVTRGILNKGTKNGRSKKTRN